MKQHYLAPDIRLEKLSPADLLCFSFENAGPGDETDFGLSDL